MAIQAALFTRLTTFAGLSALVGTRVFPKLAAQDCPRPYVTYHRISSLRPGRAFGSDGDLRQARYQFSVYADSYDAMDATREQIVAALDRWAPPGGPGSDQTLVEEPGRDHPFDDASQIHMGSVDALITYRE